MEKPLLSKHTKEKTAILCTTTRLLTAIIVLALLLIIGLAIGLGVIKGAYETIFVIHTDGGRVKGHVEDETFVFKGIPYAKPPTGERRWAPPQACKKGDCWEGVLPVARFGSMCVQRIPGIPDVLGSENCLYLNVWTPGVQLNKKRPVMFYIHGGYLTMGSGTMNTPSPELVKAMDIVAVSINYRLNAFGFLALDALAHGSPQNTSGNYGFMDQILALKWVKNNIEKFGGDPKRVTLLGQSSGGTSELALLASPLAKGLFHRAVIMSASPVFNKSSADAAKDNEVFLKKSKCISGSLAEQRACLYRLSPEAVIRSVPWNEYPYWSMTDLFGLPTPGRFDGALATVDGYVVPVSPLRAMTEGRANDVPIMIGNTAQEVDLTPGKDFSNSTLEEFENYTRTRLLKFMSVSDVDKAIAMYVQNNSLHLSQLYYSNIVADMRAICPTDVFANNATTGFNSSVYRYIITNRPSKPVHMKYFSRPIRFAFHMWDQEALFGFPQDLLITYPPTERDRNYMKDLRMEIGSFMRSGKVQNAAWKRFPESTGLFTNDGVKVVSSYHQKECRFWMDRGFFSYGWIN